jgi:mRNA-degrading endonuclease RelE of RelBE toxin-antitoxin system
MRYRLTPSYERRFKSLPGDRKEKVRKALRMLAALFETGEMPAGLGLKSLTAGVWEVRAGLADRVLFQKNADLVEFLIVGTHDEVRKYLKER